jgi:aryl-alcohol dehydrogenase-like predicted oxidoreductase
MTSSGSLSHSPEKRFKGQFIFDGERMPQQPAHRDIRGRLMRLGLGCWASARTTIADADRQDSVKAVHAALRCSIRHFDMPKVMGRVVPNNCSDSSCAVSHGNPEGTLCIATKIFLPSSPADIPRLLDISLRRLCTSHVDILYIHWPDSTKDCRSYLEQMSVLRERGLCKAVGVSNFPAPLLEQACSVTRIDWCQMPLSLIWTRSYRSLAYLCGKEHIRTATYSPLGSGLLSGRYREKGDLPSQDHRRDLFPFTETSVEAWRHLCPRSRPNHVKRIPTWPRLRSHGPRTHPVDTVLTERAPGPSGALGQGRRTDCATSAMEALDHAAGNLDASIDDSEDNPFFHRW